MQILGRDLVLAKGRFLLAHLNDFFWSLRYRERDKESFSMTMVGSAIDLQLTMVQQRLSVSMLKQAADAQQAVADMVSEMVTASARGQRVDLHA